MSAGLDGKLLIVAALAYLLASVAYGAHLFLRTQALAVYGRITAVIGILAHTLAIGIHCAYTHATPFRTPAETLSAVAWAVVTAYLLLDLFLKPRPFALGAFALPSAFLCVFAGAVFELAHPAESSGPLTKLLDSNLVSLHVVALLLAFGLLVLAVGCAVFYLIQHRLLKRKKFVGLFGKLPPLSTLEHQAFTLVAFAFPLLTVGLLSGILRASAGGLHGVWILDPKILASTVIWLVYGAYLLVHASPSWRGPRANYLLIGGFIVALLTLFIPTSVHRFG